MQIIPVIDLKDKIAVHGKSGNRDEYKPLKSVICKSSNPIDVAMAYKERGAETIYIADLNAIIGNGNNFEIIKEIDFVNKIVDIGIKKREDLENIKKFLNKKDRAIVATETLKEIELIKEKDIVVSLDFKNGKLLNYNLDEILSYVREDTPLIILDISSVGTQRGINVELIKYVLDKTNNPVYVGGGIKGMEDLELCYNLGVDGVLIATAIHKGILDLEEIINRFGK
ncbi:phosphoribosylformimino-5-aminoimidazole carboxamide ribotide isomerase [Methanocaldococcus bathoardescens]|uniref:Phosphoribosylformimino-5-aminoimidazole carboxamide ribotide isomerase n=1 Tax=Methanocaldococcus bathoardescens TaxID=1301915 RepID=A0A076LHV6_9EURY|nr:HisA/HisF family protein [Methanocaldococcus bathoardescens]AIJ06038.1 phosphoribosylformimino-5-aminoimidazole carboxamide ribotide isomerase [Methanocaldococcus bathoardescens]